MKTASETILTLGAFLLLYSCYTYVAAKIMVGEFDISLIEHTMSVATLDRIGVLIVGAALFALDKEEIIDGLISPAGKGCLVFTEKEMANYVRGPERLPEKKHFSVNEARHVGANWQYAGTPLALRIRPGSQR